MTTFLTQINICKGRGVAESHEVALFLQLYGANSWIRRTGMTHTIMIHYSHIVGIAVPETAKKPQLHAVTGL